MEHQEVDSDKHTNRDSKNDRELHILVLLICILSILRNIISFFVSIINLIAPESFKFNGVEIIITNHSLSLLKLVSSIALIVIFSGILAKKKWGVLGFFFIQILVLILGLFLGYVKYSLFNFLIWCALFSLILMIKKNGKNAWQTIFNKQIIQKNEIELKQENCVQTMAENIVSNEENCDFLDNQENTDDQRDTFVNDSFINQEHFLSENEPSIRSEQKRVIDDEEINKQADKYVPLKTPRIGQKFLICLMCVIVGTLAGIAILTCIHNNMPEKKFEKANILFSEGKMDDAIAIYTELADKENYTKAQTRLGVLYLDNDSVPLDSMKGMLYLEKAYVNDTVALEYLMYINQPRHECKGVILSNPEKFEYYSKYAIRNKKCLATAYFCIGNINGSKGEYDLAYYNWEMSAKFGMSEAFSNLGWLFYWGKGCKIDYEKARFYFEKAIERNEDDEFSLFHLGLIYKNGNGVPVDIIKAKKFLKRSAELGREDAQKVYAEMELNNYE
ncbi:MAG: hypothetical protein ACI4A8_06080 [Muribaculaceae bacterium]